VRQLSMMALKTDAYEDLGDETIGVLRAVIENIGVAEAASSLGVTPRAIYQALSGRDNRKAPVEWLPALLDLDVEYRLIRLLCEMAGGTFVPIPKLTAEEKLAALVEEVAELGRPGYEALKKLGLKPKR
jgi:hypothetical protein